MGMVLGAAAGRVEAYLEGDFALPFRPFPFATDHPGGLPPASTMGSPSARRSHPPSAASPAAHSKSYFAGKEVTRQRFVWWTFIRFEEAQRIGSVRF